MESARNREKYRARYGVLSARPLRRRDLGGIQGLQVLDALKPFFVPKPRCLEITPFSSIAATGEMPWSRGAPWLH
jgi:hypothetical protein